jgi:predicted GIY-YIG superfamily endonuclease
MWHLYLVRTAGGRLYTGIATDVDRRLAEHRVKRLSKSEKERLVATAPDADALRGLLGLFHA